MLRTRLAFLYSSGGAPLSESKMPLKTALRSFIGVVSVRFVMYIINYLYLLPFEHNTRTVTQRQTDHGNHGTVASIAI